MILILIFLHKNEREKRLHKFDYKSKIQIYELLQPMTYETVLLLALKQQKSEKYIEDENVNRMHFSRKW